MAWMRGLLAVVLVIQLGAVGSAKAEPDKPLNSAGSSSPWSVGVSESQKKLAQEELASGNTFFADGNYEDAAKHYERALASWAHPAIRFNLVNAYMKLRRHLDANAQIDKVLEYGESPLGPEMERAAKLALQTSRLPIAWV